MFDVIDCPSTNVAAPIVGKLNSEASLLAGHQALRADPRLFKDDVDIRFSRTLNSCKLPQVRYATPERLLQRLTDLRFLSIDFLNTFLLTYRVFTDGETVLNALKSVFYDPPVEPSCDCEHQTDFLELPYQDGRASPRRTSGASSVSGKQAAVFAVKHCLFVFDIQFPPITIARLLFGRR